jgi:hypothetical protein
MDSKFGFVFLPLPRELGVMLPGVVTLRRCIMRLIDAQAHCLKLIRLGFSPELHYDKWQDQYHVMLPSDELEGLRAGRSAAGRRQAGIDNNGSTSVPPNIKAMPRHLSVWYSSLEHGEGASRAMVKAVLSLPRRAWTP